MEISEALIQRFFEGACNVEEAAVVQVYLESHPDVMERYLGKQEWDQLSGSAAAPTPLQSARMLAHIQQALWEKPVRKLSWRYAGVAAALLLIAGTWFLFPETMVVEQQASGLKNTLRWKLIRNDAENIRHYQLEDGSEVDLDPGSIISLPEHFPADRRDVKMVGRALFQVAKDSKRPFTVMAENTSTTALGTKFIINAPVSHPTTTVSLLEGKVMIRVENKLNGKSSDYYLIPDQELIYTRQSGNILIRRIEDQAVALSPGHNADGVDRTSRSAAALTFYRTPVADVFQTLGQTYHVQIEYPVSGLQNHYFTGSFYAEDTLERMLQVITEVNDLEIRKTRSGYQILKIKNKFHQ
jgi:ferric-dicitrate binding protein FerR (iron transport regulator)